MKEYALRLTKSFPTNNKNWSIGMYSRYIETPGQKELGLTVSVIVKHNLKIKQSIPLSSLAPANKMKYKLTIRVLKFSSSSFISSYGKGGRGW